MKRTIPPTINGISSSLVDPVTGHRRGGHMPAPAGCISPRLIKWEGEETVYVDLVLCARYCKPPCAEHLEYMRKIKTKRKELEQQKEISKSSENDPTITE